MNLNKLASLIAKREGKKHQASIGDIREVLSILVDLEVEAMESLTINDSPFLVFLNAAKKRHVKKLKKETALIRKFTGKKKCTK